jgi:hypothetical protein
MSNFFNCPYCSNRQPITSIFKIDIDSNLSCYNCERKITPIIKPFIKKLWFKMYKIGVGLPFLFSFIYYLICRDFGISIIYSLTTCVLILFVYLFYIYISTTFKKSDE